MKTKITLLLVLLIASAVKVNAQWTRLGKFNNQVNDMMVYFNQLFIAGDFTKYNDTACYSAAHWDGSKMVPIADPLPGIGVRRLQIFNNILFGTNALNFRSQTGLATFNLNNWTPEPGFTKTQTAIYSNTDYLYVGSDLGVLTKRVRSSSIYVVLTDSINGGITAITEYNGNLVIAGNFTTVTNKSRSHIATLNGTVFDALGSGLDGNVNRLIVYNGKLYACGTFLNAGGSPAKFLAKWNGTTWTAVGGGLTSTGFNGVKDMMVYNNALYVAGEFTKAGSINATNIAKWNDTAWTAMNYTMPGYISALKVFGNSVYVASFSGDSAIVYKSPISTGINVIKHGTISATIYPNPAHNEIFINIENEGYQKLKYEVLSIEGKIILSDVWNTGTSINVSGVLPGIYFLKLQGEHIADVVRKVVIE